MTKLIKLSIAAALVATSAQAIDWSTKGKMEVELDYAKTAAGATSSTWDMDVDATVKAKFNDNFTGVVTAQADYGQADGSIQNDQDINIVKQYVQYTQGGTTVLAGKQGVGTPFFDDERGTGVVAMQNFGSFTVAAANFTSTNVNALNTAATNSTENLKAFAVIGSAAGVNYSAWFAQVTDVLDAYTIAVDTKVANVSLALRTTDVDADANNDESKLTKVSASMPVANGTATIAYATTGKQGGARLANDSDAATDFAMKQLSLGNQADADAILVAYNTTLAGINTTVSYLDGEVGTADISEAQLNLAYNVTKGVKLTAVYSEAEVGSDDTTAASMAVEFKF